MTKLLHKGAVYVPARGHRQEAVPVPESYTDKAFYHGTANTKVGEKIVQEGTLQPSTEGHNSMSPVAGRVYLTPSLDYVSAYVCGGVCQGTPVDWLMAHGGPYGYLFIIKGDGLSDMIPDEDVLGTLLCENRPSWLRDTFESLLEEYPNDYREMSDKALSEEMESAEEDDPDFDPKFYSMDYSFLRNVYDCQFPEVALAGKFLLEYMEEEDIVDLLEDMSEDVGNAISHDGPVQFSEAWRFDKDKAPQLKEDASNFFDLAERIK